MARNHGGRKVRWKRNDGKRIPSSNPSLQAQQRWLRIAKQYLDGKVPVHRVHGHVREIRQELQGLNPAFVIHAGHQARVLPTQQEIEVYRASASSNRHGSSASTAASANSSSSSATPAQKTGSQRSSRRSKSAPVADHCSGQPTLLETAGEPPTPPPSAVSDKDTVTASEAAALMLDFPEGPSGWIRMSNLVADIQATFPQIPTAEIEGEILHLASCGRIEIFRAGPDEAVRWKTSGGLPERIGPVQFQAASLLWPALSIQTARTIDLDYSCTGGGFAGSPSAFRRAIRGLVDKGVLVQDSPNTFRRGNHLVVRVSSATDLGHLVDMNRLTSTVTTAPAPMRYTG